MSSATEERVITTRHDQYVLVKVNVDQRSISLKWKGYAPSEQFRAILEDALSNVRLHRVVNWLADLRDMNAILRQDEQWTVNDWFPRLAKAGLERMAILMSSDYFNQMSVDRILDAAIPDMPFAISNFDDPDAAQSWLMADREAL
jgi:SpoIIAA-like